MAAIAALLLILFLYRPGVYRLRNRIATSIGSALGRRVSIDNVRFHILPRPGFDLEGLVIYDAPAFSAEPMIRAQDVFAAIRLRSLFLGRLEIARLSATEPSINIVRNNEGRWNLASLIERNAQIPAAPTAKPSSERRPGFPYLEATGARINFKIGLEKKPYALTDADVALWQDSENSWGARMKAHPMRTDFNLTDTGQLQVNAGWQRAPSLRQTPMRIVAAWTNGQLGQITELLTGKDRGWRGGAELTATFSGTPEALAIESKAAITGFRRYDIVDTRNVHLATGCTGTYSAMNRTFTDLLCESPVGTGRLQVRGNVAAMPSAPTYDLTLSVEKAPLASLVWALREAKQQLPADLTADGLLNAEFGAVRKGTQAGQWSGSGEASGVQLISNGGKDRITLGDVSLTMVSDSRCCLVTRPGRTDSAKEKESEPTEAHLRIGPASVKVNESAPMSAGGWIAAGGYRFSLRGDTELKDLFRLEAALGVPSTRPAAEGAAKLDLSISGRWQGLAAPIALGMTQLRNVRAEMHGLNTPIEIASANVLLEPDSVTMEKIAAQTGSTHWSGSVTAPRRCAPHCDFQVDLAADQLSTAHLAEWFGQQPAKRPWYRILSSDDQSPSPFLALQAHGSLRVAEFALKKLTARQVATRIRVDRGMIALNSVRAQLLQGTHEGDWTIDALAHPPRYHGTGKLQNVSLAQVASLMNDAWISGTGDGTFDVEASGIAVGDLLANAEGMLRFDVRDGTLSRVEIPGAPKPLPMHLFRGSLQAKKGEWELVDGRLESRDGLYQVTGTAGADTGMDFTLTRSDKRAWHVTGSLAKPRVAATKPSNREGSKATVAQP
jgi:hypothetical protein